MTCSACLRPACPVDFAAFVDKQGVYVCLPCVKARHLAVIKRRCVCKADEKREKYQATSRGRWARRWITCERCLGTVKQIS